MTTNRKLAIVVGLLFLVGDVAGVLSRVVTGSMLSGTSYLASIAANDTRLIAGALFILLMGFALALVPVVMFPLFRKVNEILAIGCVLFRGALETVAYVALAGIWLLLASLGRESAQAAAATSPAIQTWGTLLLESQNWAAQLLGIVFSLGALMFYALFYQSGLIPRWLTIWGLIGAAVYLCSPLLGLFGVVAEYLMAPLALQELVLALWLLIKGFTGTDRTAPSRVAGAGVPLG